MFMEAARHDPISGIAPAFSLAGTGGEEVRLWRFKQRKNVVLYFFDAGCRKCEKALEQFNANYPRYRSLNSEVLGISPQSMPVLERYRKDLDLAIRLLSDRNGRVFERYGLIREDGRVRQAVFLLDRFNAIEQFWLPGEDLPDQRDILASLELAESRCPE